MGVFDDELRAAWGKLPKEKQDDLWRRYFENRRRYLTKMGVENEAATKQATEDANGLAKGNYIPHVIEPSAQASQVSPKLAARSQNAIGSPEPRSAESPLVSARIVNVAPSTLV